MITIVQSADFLLNVLKVHSTNIKETIIHSGRLKMTNKIYAIQSSGGEYEDCWTKIEYVTSNEEDAKSYISKMNVLVELIKLERIKFHEYTRSWVKNNTWSSFGKATYPNVNIWNTAYLDMVEKYLSEIPEDVRIGLKTYVDETSYEHIVVPWLPQE
jgi:hypothetical protein